MALVRRDPEHLSSFQDEMNRLFDDFFAAPLLAQRGRGVAARPQWLPALEVSENEKAIVVKAEMPGIATEDIDIQVDEDVLTLRGEKKEQKKREGENVHHVERRYGSFLRQIRLPNAVDAERTVATMNHGVLTLELPKVAPKTGRKIAVKPGA